MGRKKPVDPKKRKPIKREKAISRRALRREKAIMEDK